MNGNRSKRSVLLTNDENEIIVSMLGHRCKSLATGVVQLVEALPESRGRWTKKTTGVACFVKDNHKRSYFIRVYDLNICCLSWEQELYTRFKYNTVRPYFHTFAAHNYNVGLNFASEEEAGTFKHQIQQLMWRRSVSRRKKKGPSVQNTQIDGPPSIPNGGNGGRVESKKRSKKRQRKITKKDIGNPANFQHVEHIGWNPEVGFDVNVDMQDDRWKSLLTVIGVTEQQIGEKSTRKYIYDFVQQNGGIEAVTNMIEQETRPLGPPPPPPSRGPPPPPERNTLPPPPPSRGSAHPPPPPSRMGTLSPPPPPSRGARKPPHPPMSAPPMGAPPPPPPPPPSMGAPPPPPPIGRGSSGVSPPASAGAGRGDLFSQIQQGKQLQSVGEEMKRRTSVSDRSDLLSAIQRGATLKKVAVDDKPKSAAPAGGILGALQLALSKRDNAIHSSDDDSESEYDSDEDEWND